VNDSTPHLTPGTKLTLPIHSVHRFGFFVDVSGGLEGFVHVTQISHNPARQTTQGLAPGQTVTLWVLDANLDTGRVALTMIDPAAPSIETLRQGQQLTGIVVRVEDTLGAFVDIGTEREGLVHISAMSRLRVKRASDIVREGDRVTVWVKSVDLLREQISLSLLPPPRCRVSDLRYGMILEGTVVGFRDFPRGGKGVFVTLDVGEVDGTGWRYKDGMIFNPPRLLEEGDIVRVQVLSVQADRSDPNKTRISLSLCS